MKSPSSDAGSDIVKMQAQATGLRMMSPEMKPKVMIHRLKRTVAVGRVEELIEYRALLHCAATHHALPYITSLLQHSARARRGDKGDGEHTHQTEHLEGVRGDGSHGLDHDAATPVFSPDPVADFSGPARDILAQHEADAADRLTVNVDAEARLHMVRAEMLDVRDGVGFRVGMRKTVAEILPHASVIGMTRQALGVGQLERAKQATATGNRHDIVECGHLVSSSRRKVEAF
jgi:hypothetical protein